MSDLFDKLCRSHPLNLPDNMRIDGEGMDIAETQELAGASLDAELSGLIDKSTVLRDSRPPPDIFRYHPRGYILPSPTAQARLKYISTLSEETCASFDEWKACGYRIKRGAKSMFKDIDGVPQFTIEQVDRW